MSENVEMMRKKYRTTIIIAIITIIAIVVSLSTATYAWFTFLPSTNVTPVGSTISEGDIILLISNSREGEYAESCSLVLSNNPEVLKPVSTNNLESFYSSIAQDEAGKSVLFTGVDKPDDVMLHGTVYLKCTNGTSDVYFHRDGLNLASNPQVLAASRLGLLITEADGTVSKYIFRLDSLVNGAVSKRLTVPKEGTVIDSVKASSEAVFVDDISDDIGLYMTGEGEEDYAPGSKLLCTLSADEIASVEYWYYLEGCDENCINQVKNLDVNLQFAFAGVGKEEQ